MLFVFQPVLVMIKSMSVHSKLNHFFFQNHSITLSLSLSLSLSLCSLPLEQLDITAPVQESPYERSLSVFLGALGPEFKPKLSAAARPSMITRLPVIAATQPGGANKPKTTASTTTTKAKHSSTLAPTAITAAKTPAKTSARIATTKAQAPQTRGPMNGGGSGSGSGANCDDEDGDCGSGQRNTEEPPTDTPHLTKSMPKKPSSTSSRPTVATETVTRKSSGGDSVYFFDFLFPVTLCVMLLTEVLLILWGVVTMLHLTPFHRNC